MTEQSKSSLWFSAFGAFLLYAVIYYGLRLPLQKYGLLFYDDGETLYHTFSIISGRIPYRDDVTHHFLGYTLPFVFFGKIFGLQISTINLVAFLNQTFVGLGVYLCLRLFFPLWPSLLGGALAISAKEPFVLGLYIQHQINLIFVYCLYCSLLYLKRKDSKLLAASAFLAGLAFIFDQRAIFLSLLPFFAFLLNRKNSRRPFSDFLLTLFCGLAPSITAGCYLILNSAWSDFIDQTFVFPSKYRVGSLSTLESIWLGLKSHHFLISDAPILVVLGIIGIFGVIKARGDSSDWTRQGLTLVLAAIIPETIMPLFGGRDFDYYTVTWLPYLAILAVCGIWQLANFRRAYLLALSLPTLCSIYLAYELYQINRDKNVNDGTTQVVDFLSTSIKPQDSVYVWGYRMDLYLRLGKLAPTRIIGRLPIHPDQGIVGDEQRRKNVYPKYELEFEQFINSTPPKYVVVFDSAKAISKFSSKSQALLFSKLEQHYNKVFAYSGFDLNDSSSDWSVYQLND